jgi:hypothetical protein
MLPVTRRTTYRRIAVPKVMSRRSVYRAGAPAASDAKMWGSLSGSESASGNYEYIPHPSAKPF